MNAEGWTLPESYEELEEDLFRSTRGSRVFRRLVTDMLSRRKDAALLVTAVVIAALAGTLYPLALGFAINGIVEGSVPLMVLYSLTFLGLYVLIFFSSRIRTISSTRLAQHSIKSLRDSAFRTLQEVPVDFYGKVKTGYLISRISNDAESLSDFLTFQLPQVVAGISTVVLSIIIMTYLDFGLTLYALIIVPVMMLFTFSIQGRVRKNYLRTRKTIAAITGSMAENVGAIRAIKSFNVENRTYANFDSLNRDNLSANMRAALISSLYGSGIGVMEAAGIAIVIVAGAMQLISGAISVGLLVAFIIYVQEFFDPVLQLSQLYNSYQSAAVGLVRIYGIIDNEKEKANTGGSKVPRNWKAIDFEGVGFSYGENRALNKVNLSIAEGEKIAVVGHTGAGKTTLSNLVLRFYSPTEGRITIGGEELSGMEMRSWRGLVSPVLQDPFLFRGTVMDNVLFSKPDASADEMKELAYKYGMGEIFESLPNGLETEVGEMGRNLSEGQRQAISVMRAFIRDSPIIVLDEPTSQIDPYSEGVIMQALKSYLSDKTLILITHRFSMVSLADRIIVLDQGEIVDSGKFSELIEREGVFSELYGLQHPGNTSA
jgi:ATP-binding cassette subfamily B protein